MQSWFILALILQSLHWTCAMNYGINPNPVEFLAPGEMLPVEQCASPLFTTANPAGSRLTLGSFANGLCPYFQTGTLVGVCMASVQGKDVAQTKCFRPQYSVICFDHAGYEVEALPLVLIECPTNAYQVACYSGSKGSIMGGCFTVVRPQDFMEYDQPFNHGYSGQSFHFYIDTVIPCSRSQCYVPWGADEFKLQQCSSINWFQQGKEWSYQCSSCHSYSCHQYCTNSGALCGDTINRYDGACLLHGIKGVMTYWCGDPRDAQPRQCNTGAVMLGTSITSYSCYRAGDGVRIDNLYLNGTYATLDMNPPPSSFEPTYSCDGVASKCTSAACPDDPDDFCDGSRSIFPRYCGFVSGITDAYPCGRGDCYAAGHTDGTFYRCCANRTGNPLINSACRPSVSTLMEHQSNVKDHVTFLVAITGTVAGVLGLAIASLAAFIFHEHSKDHSHPHEQATKHD